MVESLIPDMSDNYITTRYWRSNNAWGFMTMDMVSYCHVIVMAVDGVWIDNRTYLILIDSSDKQL
jgi:hypothetical protein